MLAISSLLPLCLSFCPFLPLSLLQIKYKKTLYSKNKRLQSLREIDILICSNRLFSFPCHSFCFYFCFCFCFCSCFYFSFCFSFCFSFRFFLFRKLFQFICLFFKSFSLFQIVGASKNAAISIRLINDFFLIFGISFH